MTTVYDENEAFYVSFVDELTQTSASSANIEVIVSGLGDLRGKRVADLACGEGFLSRLLASKGALVTGFDASSRLIEHAGKRSDPSIRYEVADVQTLATVSDGAFDAAVCHMAAMDIPDIDRLFATARRVLAPGGRFVLTVLHPCFETPFSGDEAIAEADGEGHFLACRVMHYKDEGHWNSGGRGVRGRMGAWHRMLSTYLNALLDAGLTLERFAEPFGDGASSGDFQTEWAASIPRRLTIFCRAA